MFELGIQKNWIDALCARSSVRQYTGAPDKEQLDRLGETCRKLSWQGVKIRMFKGPGLKSQIKGTDVYAVIVAKRGTPMEVEGYMGEALVLEANHDVDLLQNGPYPYYLKERILSDQGHLSNETAAAFAVARDRKRVEFADMHRAVRLLDFTFGRSPFFRMRLARKWIDNLARPRRFAGLLNQVFR